MKKIVVVLVSLVVSILVIVGNVFAQDETPEAPPSIPPPPYEPPIPEPSLPSEWKLIARKSNGTTVYVNAKKITHLPKGFVKVWTLWVPRGEERENGRYFKPFPHFFKERVFEQR